VQIIPWGKLDEVGVLVQLSRHGTRVEVTAEETTHPQGTICTSRGEVWKYFLEGQNVTIDIPRLR
jgi:hypothetical protein